jgi:hypothetical protein
MFLEKLTVAQERKKLHSIDGRGKLITISSSINFNLSSRHIYVTIPVAARFKEWVYGRSLAGIAGSNPVGGMDVCLLRVLYVAR